jgi:hypothetical protein
VRQQPGINTRDLNTALGARAQFIGRARDLALERGLITVINGANNARLHWPV